MNIDHKALTPIVGTGLSGLVGSRLVELLSDEFSFTNLDITHGVDILDKASVEKALAGSSAKCLLHLAAFTDVNAAQEQKGDKNGSAWRVNVEGTRNIAEACAKHNIHLIHFSTGYVFDGQKSEAYVETDPKNPTDWYSETKSVAEDIIQDITPNATILRINFPYRSDEFPKRDIWHKIADGLQAGKNGPFFDDHFFTLTPVEWLADVVRWSIHQEPAGIFHTTTETVYTDLSLAQEIRDSLGLKTELLSSSVVEYNQRAPRPYQPSLVLSSEKLRQAMSEHP